MTTREKLAIDDIVKPFDTILLHHIWSRIFCMGWFILAQLFSTILSFIQVSRLSDQDKDLEVIILRHQLAVMTRLHAKPGRKDDISCID